MSVTWSGLDELRAALKNLPKDLAERAADIIDNRAELAKSEIVQSYPRRTGDLRDHVTIETKSVGSFGISVTVKNTSKLAWIFENGTQARHNKLGANRGVMPPGHVFGPPCGRHRGRMWGELKALVESRGLKVTGGRG